MFRIIAWAGLTWCYLGVVSGTFVDAQVFRRGAEPRDTSNDSQDPNLRATHATARQEAENSYQEGDFEECASICQRILQENPRDHVALYLRSSSRVELGLANGDGKQIRDGVEDAREAIRAGGSGKVNYYLPYMYGMTGLAQLEGKVEHAAVSVQVADSLLARGTLAGQDRANVLYQKAVALVASRKLDDAVANYREAIKAFPTHLGAHLGLADTLVLAGKGPEADQVFTSTIAAFPDNPLVYNNRGMLRQQQNRPTEAIADFTKALQLDNEFLVARINRGYALLSAGGLAAAEADFSAVLAVDAENPLPYGLRASSRLLRGDAAQAIADYNQVLKLDSKNPVAWGDLGFAKYFTGDYPGAMEAFNQAVTIDQNLRYVQPWQFLCLLRSGQKSQAETSFKPILEKPADKQDWIDKLLLFLADRLTYEQLQAAISQDPNLRIPQSCEAAFFAAEKKAIAGDTAGARPLYEQAIGTNARQLSAFRASQFAVGRFLPAQ